MPEGVFTKHNKIPADYDTRLRTSLDMADLKYIIHSLPLRYAPGPDGVPNERLRFLPEAVLERILAVINLALTKGVFLSWWNDCAVTLMTKKAPPERLTNQRPVALLNTVYKIFSIVLNARLTRTMEENGILEPEQEGGRRQRNTIQQLQRLLWQIQDARQCNKRIYAMFVDTSNAFGSVSHRVLCSLLWAYGLPKDDVKFFKQLYNGSRFHVCGPFGTTADVHTMAGVNHITFPLLWNLVINASLRYVKGAGHGYHHSSGVSTSMLCYINNAAVLSDSVRGFRNLVHRMNRFYKWAGLRVNNAKCAVFAHDFATGQRLATQHIRING
jgi:hypothetical protein